MVQNPEIIRKRQHLYEQFWSRSAAVYHPEISDEVHIDVFVFRPTWRFWAPARRYFVYMTGGLSDITLPLAGSASGWSRRELLTFTITAPGLGQYDQDQTAKWLMRLARTAAMNAMAFAPGDTFNCGEPLTPGSEMTGFYFANPMFVNRSSLCTATVQADTVAHVIPISAPNANWRRTTDLLRS